MGMFDDVVCLYPLPNPAHNEIEFQTKDLACELELYVITKDGRLARQLYTDSEVPEEKRPWWVAGAGIQREPTGLEYLDDYHGDLLIYGSETTGADDDEWVQYIVRFTEGRVSRVRLTLGSVTQEVRG